MNITKFGLLALALSFSAPSLALANPNTDSGITACSANAALCVTGQNLVGKNVVSYGSDYNRTMKDINTFSPSSGVMVTKTLKSDVELALRNGNSGRLVTIGVN